MAAEINPSQRYYICNTCTHPVLYVEGKTLVCGNCGHRDRRLKPKNARLSLMFSLLALIFFVPAMLFPFMTVELYGNRTSSTIWTGTLELAARGSFAIALIVFLASILIPVIKLLILFYLSLTYKNGRRQQFKSSLYHFVEAIGRWSMLDIFLLAVLVAVMKLGPMTDVSPAKGSVMFLLVVIFTMLASAFFDPKLIWEVQTMFEKLKDSWYLWLFPLFALLITGWLIFDYYNQTGPRIKILFDDAAGIQAEKTKVRFRGVPIGTVSDVYISEDQKDVIAEVLLRRDAKQFAVEGSKFSLVTPKVGFNGVSGLETIFEGTYIAVLPGPKDGKEKDRFNAQTSTTATDPLDDTSPYHIETSNAENINPGDAVTFRGMKIGSVTKSVLAKDSRTVLLQINVENKYVRVIRVNTIFWSKVGVQAKLGLFGSDIKVNSLDSIMNGGIEIATPAPAGALAKAGQKFPLYPMPPKDYLKWNTPLEFD